MTGGSWFVYRSCRPQPNAGGPGAPYSGFGSVYATPEVSNREQGEILRFQERNDCVEYLLWNAEEATHDGLAMGR